MKVKLFVEILDDSDRVVARKLKRVEIPKRVQRIHEAMNPNDAKGTAKMLCDEVVIGALASFMTPAAMSGAGFSNGGEGAPTQQLEEMLGLDMIKKMQGEPVKPPHAPPPSARGYPGYPPPPQQGYPAAPQQGYPAPPQQGYPAQPPQPQPMPMPAPAMPAMPPAHLMGGPAPGPQVNAYDGSGPQMGPGPVGYGRPGSAFAASPTLARKALAKLNS